MQNTLATELELVSWSWDALVKSLHFYQRQMELIYKRIDNFRELNEQAELYTLTQDALDCDARVQTLEHELNRRHSLVGVAG